MKRKVYSITLHSGQLPAAHAFISKEGRGTNLRMAVNDGMKAICTDRRVKGKRITQGTITFSFVGTEGGDK
jgi:hypothetical protein